MAVKHVIEGVHVVPMGRANAFLIEGRDGLTLTDASFPHRGRPSARRSAASAIGPTSSSTSFSRTATLKASGRYER